MNNLKISIITVCFNSEEFIKDAIDSVLNQTYSNIEYIIIDGGSSDRTVEIVKSYGSKITKFISEKDKGIYDAMNKGINNSTGDIIAILNSDDFYDNPNVISNIATCFLLNNPDGIYGDLNVVYRDDISRVKRQYLSNKFTVNSLSYGIMPGHATIFLKRELFDKFGFYSLKYPISADFELLVRFFYANNIRLQYLPQIVLKARTGGISDNSFFTKLKISKEIIRACKENRLKTSLLKVNFRILIKLMLLFQAKFK